MRLTVLALVTGVAVVGSANAAPIAPAPKAQQDTNIIQAWGGCGWGFHPNRWGYCAPNRHAWYGPRRYWGGYGGYYGYGGYGGGYYPYYWHRPWYGY